MSDFNSTVVPTQRGVPSPLLSRSGKSRKSPTHVKSRVPGKECSEVVDRRQLCRWVRVVGYEKSIIPGITKIDPKGTIRSYWKGRTPGIRSIPLCKCTEPLN